MTAGSKKPELIRSQKVYSGWFGVREDLLELPRTNVVQHYSVLEAADSVIVLAITDLDEVVCTYEYRHPIGTHDLALPSGRINEGEKPLDAAQRELQEETGYAASTWELLGSGRPWVGISNMLTHCFLARDLQKGKSTQDSNEDITVKLIPRKDLLRAAKAAEVNIQQIAWPMFLYALQ